MDSRKAEAAESPPPESGAIAARNMTPLEIADQDLATTILRAAERLAGPISPKRSQTAEAGLTFATPEDYDESRLPHDFSGLMANIGRIHATMAQNPQLAHQMTAAREAFGDGETLKILFQGIFPGQRSHKFKNPDGTPILTDREVDVLREAACDISNDEIAERLHIATRTVSTHLGNIYRKLNVQRPLQAVARAISMGYLNLDVLDIVQGAGHNGARNYRLFDSLACIGVSLNQPPFDAALRPVAEFALFLLLTAGAATCATLNNRNSATQPPVAVCELEDRGRVVQRFGEGRLFGGCGLTIAPPQAARQGFTPGNLFAMGGASSIAELNQSHIHEFTPDGRFVRSFAGGREVGTRLTGSCLAFHTDGRLLASSGGYTDAALAFRRGGRIVRRFAEAIACGLCASPSGAVYVVNGSSVGASVRVLEPNGKLHHKFGLTPAGDGYAGIAVTSRGHLWAVRSENDGATFALVEFAHDGTEIRRLPLSGLDGSLLAIDAEDRLYVPCGRSGDLKILSPDGKILARHDLRGKIAPHSVAVSPEGRIYVAGKVIR